MEFIYHRLVILWISLLFISCSKNESSNSTKTIFKYNQSGGIGSLDPAFAGNQPNIWATNQLFNGLVEFDSVLKVQPCLADSWELQDEGLTYVFHIRKGVFFHNDPLFKEGKGRELSAFDVLYSFKRITNPTTVFNKGMWIFKGKVLADSSGNIAENAFEAPNDSTFIIHLQRSFPFFLEFLAMPYAFIVPQEITEHYQLDFRSHPIGTGPFVFKEWDESNGLILLKNENYWRKDLAGNSLPYLDAIQVSFVDDKSQTYRNFWMGNLDYFNGIEEGILDELLFPNGELKPLPKEKFHIQKGPYLNTEYLCFQLDPLAPCYKDSPKHPFLNKDFRKALSYALDKKRMVYFLKNGLGEAGIHGMIPSAVSAYPIDKVHGYAFRLDSARIYLAKSGVDITKLPKLVLTVAKEHKSLSEYIVKEWLDNLGVQVEVELVDAKVYRTMAEKGEVSLFRSSWIGDYPDPENYLSLFYSENKTPNGPNKSRFQSKKFDALYSESSHIQDDSLRFAKYLEMDQLLMQEVPVIVLFYDEILQLQQKNISGLTSNPMNMLYLENVKK